MTTSTIPGQVEPKSLSDYLEVMSRAVFQAGLKWASIAQQWERLQAAFDGFDCERVAAYTEFDVDRIMETEGILHSARKVRATIQNAQKIVELDRAHSGFQNYLHAFPDYTSLAADIRKNFKFMGDMNVWYFLFRIRKPVPNFDEWVKTIPGDHPRMKEMVEKARAAGTSTEVTA